MNNEEIRKGIQKYQELQDKKQVLLEIQKLQTEQIVIDYIELLDKIDKKPDTSIPSTEQQVLEAFDQIALQTMDSNKIYVYIGYPEKVTRGEPINMRLYKDLETGYERKVHPFDLSKFANNHCIVHPTSHDNYQRTLEYYTNLRNEFFLQLTIEPQEKVVQKILKRD